MLFGFVNTSLLYAILLLQPLLTFYDPENLTTSLTSDLAMNTAVSFFPALAPGPIFEHLIMNG